MKLAKIPGEKIRRQYFNIPIYLILSFSIPIIICTGFLLGQEHKIASTEWWYEIVAMGSVLTMPLLPLAILSLLNRFLFGEVICVLDHKGIHFDDGHSRFVHWSDIQRAIYEPDLPGRVGRTFRFSNNMLRIIAKPFKKEVEIELDGAPFFLMRKMKKYCPKAKIGLSGFGIFLIAALAVAPSVIAILTILLDET